MSLVFLLFPILSGLFASFSAFDFSAQASAPSHLANCLKELQGQLPVPEFNWDSFYDDVERATLQNIQANHSRYSQALARGDTHLQWLTRLGFRFDAGQVKVPSVTEIVRNYETEIGKLIQRGLLDEKSILRPGLAFQDKKGQFHFFKLGEAIPPGFKPSSSILPAREFHRMISQGLFPMGGPEKSIRNAENFISDFEHDLAHITGFGEFHSQMKLYRQSSPKAAEFSEHVFRAGLDMRSYYVTESLVLFRHDAKAQLPEIMRHSGWTPDKKSMSVGEVAINLYKLRPEELVREAKELNALVPQVTRRYGGAARDPYNGYDPSSADIHAPFISELNDVVSRGLEKQLSQPGSVTQQLLVPRLAQVKVFLLELSKIDASTFFEEAFRSRKLGVNDKLYPLFCASGLFSSSAGPLEEFFKAFCSD